MVNRCRWLLSIPPRRSAVPAFMHRPTARNTSAEHLYMAAQRISRGKPLDDPEAAFALGVAVSKVREAQEAAGARLHPDLGALDRAA